MNKASPYVGVYAVVMPNQPPSRAADMLQTQVSDSVTEPHMYRADTREHARLLAQAVVLSILECVQKTDAIANA